MLDYLLNNYILLVIIVGTLMLLSIFPLKNKKLQITMMVTSLVVFLLSIAVYCDDYISDNYDVYVPSRVLFSYLNYTLKVISIGCLFLLFANKKKHYIFVIVTSSANALFYSLMFFTKLVVWFDESNIFQGTFLRFFFFIPCIIYLALLLNEFFKIKRIGRIKESILVLVVAFFILISTFIEIESDTIKTYTETIIALTCLFYFIEIRITNDQYDIVTSLLSRKCYTVDITNKWKKIDCVISMDLNNLKLINDTQGHDAGDKALGTVGEILNNKSKDYSILVNRTYVPYRVGGDEMAVLIYRRFNKPLTENEIESFINDIQKSVKQKGYGIAVGYAMNDRTKLINQILDLADKNMYQNKKEMKSFIDKE